MRRVIFLLALDPRLSKRTPFIIITTTAYRMSIPLQKIYSVFAPSPLRPDPQAMYVNLDDVRGDPGMGTGWRRRSGSPMSPLVGRTRR